MRATDLTNTEVLKLLLEQQLRSLATLHGQAEQAIRLRGAELPPEHWQGIARNLYDVVARALESDLRRGAHSLEEAATQTRRALATLGDRVG